MRKHGGEQIGLVWDEAVEGDIGHISVGFQFGKDVFLGTASVVKVNDLSGACGLVGEDDLVGEAKHLGNKEVQLDGFLGLHNLFCPDEKESASTVPGFRFPYFLEKRGIAATR